MAHTPSTWPAKDPDARLDFTFTIPLDEGDSVTAHTFVKLHGTAVLESQARDGAIISGWISGGEDGDTSVFKASWVTSEGREAEAIVFLPIVANGEEMVAAIGYAKPKPIDLQMRFPEFADVDTGIIAYWLKDAEQAVDASWMEGDFAPAIMALAAHNLALSGQGAQAEATADLPPGITAMKIGTLGLSFDASITKAKAEGTWGATRYGVEFRRLQRRNRGGPMVTPTGRLPYIPVPYPYGDS